MKSFFKKLAFVMALAMVVSMVAPAGSALAAESGVSLQGTKTIVETYELDKVGATVDFSFQGAPKDWKSTFKWTSSNEAVATVTPAGVVTAVAAGTATIKITAGADASYAETVVVTVKAEEVKGAFEISQVNTDTVTLTFDKAPKAEELEAGLAFNMVIANVPVTLPVNKVTVKDNVATVSVFNTFVDGEEYSFVYGDDTVAFTASVGEIDRVEFSYYTGEDPTKNIGVAWVNEEDGEDFDTTFVPKFYDANGIDITAKYDLDDDVEIAYELVNENDDIELDEEEGVITFDAVAAAAIKMIVTWEDDDDEEVSKEYTGVVVAEKLPEISLEYVKSGFVKADSFDHEDAMTAFTTQWWTAFWNGAIKLDDSYTYVAGDSNTYQFAALFNDNRGNKVVSGNTGYKYGSFSYASSNDDVLGIDEDGEIEFYEAGSAYVLVYFTPENDDDDAKPVLVGSQKITVGPARYATAFKVLNTSASAATNALTLHSYDTDNFNKVYFEVKVTDQTGAGMWTADFKDLFTVTALKEENKVKPVEIKFDWGTGTYKIWFDADDFTLEEDDDSEKFKYELTMDTDTQISKYVKTKASTLTLKVEDNYKEAMELAAFLEPTTSSWDCGYDIPVDTKAADEFDIDGFKGGYPIDLNIKAYDNYKSTSADAGVPQEVKLGWATNLVFQDSNGYTLAKVPADNFEYKTKDITSGDLGTVYYTIFAPSDAITYDKETKEVEDTLNWTYTVADGGIVFQWNSDRMFSNYYNKTGDFTEYALTGEYGVTFWAAKKDGGKLYEKGTYTFNVSNSQARPTFEGFVDGMDNYTELSIPEKTENMTASDYKDLSDIVMAHLFFKWNGVELDEAKDWAAAGVTIDWTKSDYSAFEDNKLRIKKLCLVAPIDSPDEGDVTGDANYDGEVEADEYVPSADGEALGCEDGDETFETYVSVGKNIYYEED